MRGRLQVRSSGLNHKHMLMKQVHFICDKTPLILLQRNHLAGKLPHDEVHPKDENPSNVCIL
jgi:thiamine monophosphate synthase